LPPPPPDDEHDCGWKKYALELGAEMKELATKLEELERKVAGHKSERRRKSKLPPPIPPRSPTPEETEKKRAETALLQSKVETDTVELPVPPESRTCPSCKTELRSAGSKSSVIFEYVQAHFRKRTYRRETRSCRCGHIVTAPAPARVGEKTRYAPSFVAHLVVQKCDHSIPQYRLEKIYKQIGIAMSRSTMCDLIHRAADELRPIYNAALALVPKAPDINADETSVRQLGLDHRAYFWDFVTPTLVVFVYAPDRSGDTPKKVLGDSKGRLVVDQHTGYNAVTKPGKRTRAGCLAHARRKIFEQRAHPETKYALDIIGEIYAVERQAADAGIVGTEAHLALRKSKSRPLFARLLWWAHTMSAYFEPKSAMGKAIGYTLRHFRDLGQFLRYATIAPDNNAAEAGLRRVALGRKNFLFFGNDDAGKNFAVLYTLVATCEKNGVNPIAYLTDVLTRVHSHPASRIEELLPAKWRPPDKS
jgi:transposase